MKLRMAPNSLFAVLLRSPWWISMTVALVMGAASFALLPTDYRYVGAMGGTPFVVIGFVALSRQLRAPSARQSSELLSALAGMGWPELRSALEQGFTRQGWSVTRTQGAADLLLQQEGRRAVVSARRWKAARHGEEALQALQGATVAHAASTGIYVALGDITPQARQLAKRHGLQILEGAELVQLLRGMASRSS